MIVWAVDPGTAQSALVVYDAGIGHVAEHTTLSNHDLLLRLLNHVPHETEVLVVEMIESFGMAVGAEVFRTVWFAGRFHQAWDGAAEQLPRRAIKSHLCHSARATDANIRAAILDRFGGSHAIGLKKSPGPLYGVKGHEFAALAVALTWADLHAQAPAERTG